ncbi:MAG: lamin tail domain-containing protein, partial [Planctomycetota bacterium]
MKPSRKGAARRPLGCQRLEPRLVLDASMLRITEFVASNDNSLADFEGDSPDWIELYNPSLSSVDLQGLHLTDEADEPDKWAFPSGAQIEA